MQILFNIFPRISLHCKVVSVQYWEYEYGLLRALSFCQNWPVRPVSLERKRSNLKEHLHDNPWHSYGGVRIILEEGYIEGVVELRPGQTLATFLRNILQHCWAQHVAYVCMATLLRYVACVWLVHSTHFATSCNIVARCWVEMLQAFGQAFSPSKCPVWLVSLVKWKAFE